MQIKYTDKSMKSVLYALLTMAATLLGWGVDDVRGYFRETPRALYSMFRVIMFGAIGLLIERPFKGAGGAARYGRRRFSPS